MNTVYFSICLCFQFFLSVCYSFLRTGVLLPLVRFISVYFVLFDAVVTGIIVLISLSDSFLLVYGNATDFYIVYFVSYNFSEFIFGQIHFWCLFCCSVAQSCLTLCNPMDCMQHTMLPCPSLSPGACSNSSPLSRWCHPTISSYVIPFSSCLLSFPT